MKGCYCCAMMYGFLCNSPSLLLLCHSTSFPPATKTKTTKITRIESEAEATLFCVTDTETTAWPRKYIPPVNSTSHTLTAHDVAGYNPVIVDVLAAKFNSIGDTSSFTFPFCTGSTLFSSSSSSAAGWTRDWALWMRVHRYSAIRTMAQYIQE